MSGEMTRDEFFMRRCLELGRAALENGDAPVGSIVVKNGEIIAEAVESVRQSNDPTAHAETLAVRAACTRLAMLDLSGCDLYTNVEPCWMCAYAIRQARISHVCFGSGNERVGGANSKFAVLLDNNLKPPVPIVTTGILATESDAMLAEFEKRNR